MKRTVLSAICVSHPSRWGLLQRCILNFLDQRLGFPRELIVVVNHPGYSDAIHAYLELLRISTEITLSVYNVQFKNPAEGFAHGMGWSDGEWCVCWDDDNLSHPDRLHWQLTQTKCGTPTAMADSLYFFYDTDELFVTSYDRPSGNPADRCAAASVMFHRRDYPAVEVDIRGPWAVQAINRFHRGRELSLLRGQPWMFMVGSNGDNWRFDHVHRDLGSRLPGTLTREQLLNASTLWESRLREYRFPGETILVCGKDAQAFVAENMNTWPQTLANPLPPADMAARIPGQAWQRWKRGQKK